MNSDNRGERRIKSQLRRDLIKGTVFAVAVPVSLNAAKAMLPTSPDNGMTFRPERFGARGDGQTNDTDAFAAMAAAIEAAGSGTIELAPGATYVVGKQTRVTGQPVHGHVVESYAHWSPSPILFLTHLSHGLTIRGNGATLRCAAGLKFGTFDPNTGAADLHGGTSTKPTPTGGMPYLSNNIAVPYEAMVGLHDCEGPIRIENLELDGRAEQLVWGGGYGDTGWQIPGNGLLIERCADVVISNVNSHHHPLDGLQCQAPGRFLVEKSRFHHNCRLNGNLRAGSGFMAVDCDFDFAGKGTHFSAPAGGFDLEAEIPELPIRNPRFVNCRFRHNRYQGLAADNGNTAGARFDRCLFWSGAHQDANPVYISRPGFRFTACTLGGPLIVIGKYAHDADLPLFDTCLFTDDPSKGSLDGTVNTATGQVNVAQGGTVFRRCRFLFSNSRVPGIANSRIVFDTCLIATSPKIYTIISGTYLNCRITGARIDLNNSSSALFAGRTTVNGRLIPPSRPAHS